MPFYLLAIFRYSEANEYFLIYKHTLSSSVSSLEKVLWQGDTIPEVIARWSALDSQPNSWHPRHLALGASTWRWQTGDLPVHLHISRRRDSRQRNHPSPLIKNRTLLEDPFLRLFLFTLTPAGTDLDNQRAVVALWSSPAMWKPPLIGQRMQ